MSLLQKLCIDQLSADCNLATISDVTGVYDVNNNPEGYGVPNLERDRLALYLRFWKYYKDEEDEELTSLVNNQDPLNVTSWQFKNSKEGYYYFVLSSFLIWEAGVTYTTDYIVYHNGTYWKAKRDNLDVEPTSLVTDDWYALTTEELHAEIDLKNSSIIILEHDDFISCRSECCYGAALKDAISKGCCNSCISTAEVATYEKLDVLLQGVFTNLAQGNYMEADTIAGTIMDICKSVDCAVCNSC